MNIDYNHKDFPVSVLHFILINKINAYDKKGITNFNVFQGYGVSLRFIGMINDWLIKNKIHYLIQIRFSKIIDNGWDYCLQDNNNKEFYWDSCKTRELAIINGIDLLLRQLYKVSTSFIPETIDPEKLQYIAYREAVEG